MSRKATDPRQKPQAPVEPDLVELDDDDMLDETNDETLSEALTSLAITPQDVEDALPDPDTYTDSMDRDQRLAYAKEQHRWIVLSGVTTAIHRFRLGRVLELQRLREPNGYESFVADIGISKSTAQQSIRFRVRCKSEDQVPATTITTAYRQMGVVRRRQPSAGIARARSLAEKFREALEEAKRDEAADPASVEELEVILRSLQPEIETVIEVIHENMEIASEVRKELKSKRRSRINA